MEPPQAARDSIMAAARASASIFFFIIIFSFESVSGTMNRMRDGKKKRGLSAEQNPLTSNRQVPYA